MAQNKYDDPEFFEQFKKLVRDPDTPAGIPDLDYLSSLLPDDAIKDKQVLDLGCGWGWFARWARQHGAAHVDAVDISTNQLTLARKLTAEAGADDGIIAYSRLDLETASRSALLRDAGGGNGDGGGGLDVVFSGLALHYVAEVPALVAAVHAALRPGGRLVLSVEHPVFTAPTAATRGEHRTDPNSGALFWPLEGYWPEGRRVRAWLADGVVKYHRTVETYVGLLLAAGFEITALREWGRAPAGSESDLSGTYPWFAPSEVLPSFLLLAARKK